MQLAEVVLNLLVHSFSMLREKPGWFGQAYVSMNFCLVFEGCFETHQLVLLGHVLAVAGYFPPVLIKKIFNISFLSKLDSQLEGKYLAL